MEVFRIYKEMDISYRELSSMLRKLGYREERLPNQIRYVHDGFNSVVQLPLPRKNEDENVLKALIAGYSYALWAKGVIEDPHDLAKMIEKERLSLLSSAA